MYAIDIQGLSKQYGKTLAVDHLSLQVPEGELLSLLGVNGAGKTTTVKMLSCLTRPTEGDAYLLGKSIRRDTAAVKALIAVSPQETAVAPGLTVIENLALMCGVHGLSKEKQTRKIRELTAQLGLETVLHKKAGKLSGGWQILFVLAFSFFILRKRVFIV